MSRPKKTAARPKKIAARTTPPKRPQGRPRGPLLVAISARVEPVLLESIRFRAAQSGEGINAIMRRYLAAGVIGDAPT